MITDESCGIGLRVQQGEEIGSGVQVQGSELLAADHSTGLSTNAATN